MNEDERSGQAADEFASAIARLRGYRSCDPIIRRRFVAALEGKL